MITILIITVGTLLNNKKLFADVPRLYYGVFPAREKRMISGVTSKGWPGLFNTAAILFKSDRLPVVASVIISAEPVQMQ